MIESRPGKIISFGELSVREIGVCEKLRPHEGDLSLEHPEPKKDITTKYGVVETGSLFEPASRKTSPRTESCALETDLPIKRHFE